MRTRFHTRTRTALLRLTAGVAVLVVSACSAPPVSVLPVTLDQETRRACTRLEESLPDRLGDHERRTTEPAAPGLAAYGDPPVVIRCGAPRSAAYQRGAPLLTIEGVEWFPEEGGDVVVFSTPRDVVNVEVRVPRKYPGELLALLADAVEAAQPF